LYNIVVVDEKSKYRLRELANMFLRASEFEFSVSGEPVTSDVDIDLTEVRDSLSQAQLLYDFLEKETSQSLAWGVLTGVRPVKLLTELIESNTKRKAIEILKKDYRVSDEKIELLLDVYGTQCTVKQQASPPAIGLYIGIPFCPSRCSYCSFTSNIYSKDGSVRYINALEREMEATGLLMQEKNWHAESIYIGGGTPTSLDNESFERFLSLVTAIFMNENTKEFTVECGRPDTIDSAKLLIIKKYGGNRISINPQTMSDKTLAAIGRSHNASQIQHAFKIAHTAGCDIINADLIAGLPGESVEDFLRSLQKVIDLKPVNITVHTLAVKRASKLIEQDSDVAFRQAEAASQMVKEARSILGKVGYRPYYLYRQKHMAGNMENVGYALPGTESLYNIRIMAENQTIIALGAGGISKIYYPDENRLERIPNVANYEIYIERIDDMIRRKEIGIQ